MRVFFVPIFEIHANFVLRSHLIRSKIDDTRFRATSKQRLETMIVVVSNVCVGVGASAHASFLPDLLFADAVQHPKIGLQVEEQEVSVFSLLCPPSA